MMAKKTIILFADQAEEDCFHLSFLNDLHNFRVIVIYLNHWDQQIQTSHEMFFHNCELVFLHEITHNQDTYDNSTTSNISDLRHTQENSGLLHGRHYNSKKIDESVLKIEVSAVLNYIANNHEGSIFWFLGRHGTVRSAVYASLIQKSAKVYSLSYCLVENLILLARDTNDCIEYYGKKGRLSIESFSKPPFTYVVTSQRELESQKNNTFRNGLSITVFALYRQFRGLLFSVWHAVRQGRYNHAGLVFRSYFPWIINIFIMYFQPGSFKKSLFVIKNAYKKISLVFLHVYPEATTFDDFLEYPSELFYLHQYKLFEVDKATLFIDHPAMLLNGERPSALKRLYKSLPNSFYFNAPSHNGFPLELIAEADEVHTLCGSVALEAVENGIKVYIYARHPLEFIRHINSKYQGSKQFHKSLDPLIGTLSLQEYRNIMKNNAASVNELDELIGNFNK